MRKPPTDDMRSACYYALELALHQGHDPYVIPLHETVSRGARAATVRGLISRGLAEVRPGAKYNHLTTAGIDVAKEEWAKRTGGKPIPTPLFHRTSEEAAIKILRAREFDVGPEGPWVYFSTARAGDITSGYGGVVLRVLLVVQQEWLDDEFPDGEGGYEEHYRVPLAALRGVHVTRA